ncbi:MAG: phosphatidylglycerol lysyltransferase domain-containing protein [Thermoleophilia bacterium]
MTPATRRASGRGLVTLQRHPLGPRLYLLGRRIHEYMVGLALMLIAVGATIGDRGLPSHGGSVLAVGGGWLFVKDWNDLVPSRRDTTCWTWTIHRRPAARGTGGGAAVPWLMSLAAGLTGLVLLLGAFVPGWTVGGPPGAPVIAALGRPWGVVFGSMLLALAVPAWRRRRRAWAGLTMAGLGVLLVAVLHHASAPVVLTTSVLTWVLIRNRAVFSVDPPAGGGIGAAVRTLRRFAVVSLVVLPTTWLVVASGAMRAAGGLVPDALAPIAAAVRWPEALAAGLLALMVGVGTQELMRAATPPSAPWRSRMGQVIAIVRQHGSDTLSYFKTRSDVEHVFSDDQRAVAAYRVRAGVLLLSGDPVGPPQSVRQLLLQVAELADRCGLKLAVVGAGPAFASVYRSVGLRPFYLGDEVVVDTKRFSLEGRRIRKVRQSVNRLERAGYRLEMWQMGDVPDSLLGELQGVSAGWRGGSPERGFSMALEGVGGAHQADTWVVVARDATGAPRGFLHVEPCPGGSAASLAAMRRHRDTPNGLTEYMVTWTIASLREQGIDEISLNFVMLGRVLREPRGRFESVVRRVLKSRTASGYQIASLHRFSEKFDPDWRPRHLWYQGPSGLIRAGFAAALAEGQLCAPWHRLRQRHRAEDQSGVHAIDVDFDTPTARGRSDLAVPDVSSGERVSTTPSGVRAR